MKKYIIFYYLASDYDNVRVDAKDFSEALAISDAFYRRTGRLS